MIEMFSEETLRVCKAIGFAYFLSFPVNLVIFNHWLGPFLLNQSGSLIESGMSPLAVGSFTLFYMSYYGVFVWFIAAFYPDLKRIIHSIIGVIPSGGKMV